MVFIQTTDDEIKDDFVIPIFHKSDTSYIPDALAILLFTPHSGQV